MSFFSLSFIALLVISLAVYYLIPKKSQWIVLLISSLVFYLLNSIYGLIYILITAITTYVSGNLLGNLFSAQRSPPQDDKKAFLAAVKKKKRLILIVDLVILFGMLYIVKYWDFTAETLNKFIGSGHTFPRFNLLMPVGLSFYIFQSAGYAVDCYRGTIAPERNFPKLLLFVSFFPQLIQGPISRFDHLGKQLSESHAWNADNIKFGTQRMLWGYIKKLVIADRAGVVVTTVFGSLDNYGGIMYAVAILFYCIQLYCDFSGGIDITISVAQMFGISLTENFCRPIFATSLADYWRRWHITLGSWMRDYVFYPISMSKPFGKLSRLTRKHFKGKLGKVIPTSIATFIVYFIIGIWHGANFKYIAFGIWNGSLITLSILLSSVYAKLKAKLNIDDKKSWYKAFQMLRTMCIVFIGRYITCSPSFLTAVKMITKTITSPRLYQLRDGTVWTLGLGRIDMLIVALGVLGVLIIEWKQEKNIKIRKTLENQSVFIQFICIFIPLIVLLFLGVLKDSAIQAEFIYQQY